MKINFTKLVMLIVTIQVTVLTVVSQLLGWQKCLLTRGDKMADKNKWKVLLLNLTFAIYCFCVDTDIQLVHTRANKRMKIRLQITSELENDYWCHTTVSPTTQSRRCSTEVWLSFLRSQENSLYQKWQRNYSVSLFLCIMWCKRQGVWQKRTDIQQT